MYQIIYYILQSGRTPLHYIMSTMATLHDEGHEACLFVVDNLIEAGADVNIIDKVSIIKLHIITIKYSCDNGRYLMTFFSKVLY